MTNEQIVFRTMKTADRKEIIALGKRSFQFLEGAITFEPQNALLAIKNKKIVGAVVYKYMHSNKQAAYISEAFIDPNYQGQGIGKQLYYEAISYLKHEKGIETITALVKDDNISSSILLLQNGFYRVGWIEMMKLLPTGLILEHLLHTPMFFSYGMDFYLLRTNNDFQSKKENFISLLWFILATIVFSLPLLLYGPYVYVYALVFILIITLPRLVAHIVFRKSSRLRLNNLGGPISFIMALLGASLPLNINWYPQKYQYSKSFRRKLAIPEIIRWSLLECFIILSNTNPTIAALSSFSKFFIVLFLIPLYPFESLGSGRIFNYSKTCWLILTLATLVTCLI